MWPRWEMDRGWEIVVHKKLTFWTQGCGLFFYPLSITFTILLYQAIKACQWRVFHFHNATKHCGVHCFEVGWSKCLFFTHTPLRYYSSSSLHTHAHVSLCCAITFAIATKLDQQVDAETLEGLLFIVAKLTDHFWRVIKFSDGWRHRIDGRPRISTITTHKPKVSCKIELNWIFLMSAIKQMASFFLLTSSATGLGASSDSSCGTGTAAANEHNAMAIKTK